MNYHDRAFLSFGGGTQSTALALMLAYHPEVLENLGHPLPKHVIFADTGAEPDYVLKNVEEVYKHLERTGLKTYIVRAEWNGVADTILDEVPASTGRGFSTPPYFTRDQYGKTGILRRQCTRTYKIEPIRAKQREILGFRSKQRIPQNHAHLWLGISVEESSRARASDVKWMIHHHPLIDLRLNRTRCAMYAQKILGYVPRKSACYFCPFKHPEEWVTMKRDEPELFEQAREFDERIRNMRSKGVKDNCYIHRSALPLRDAVGTGIQMSFLNASECQGHCMI